MRAVDFHRAFYLVGRQQLCEAFAKRRPEETPEPFLWNSHLILRQCELEGIEDTGRRINECAVQIEQHSIKLLHNQRVLSGPRGPRL